MQKIIDDKKKEEDLISYIIDRAVQERLISQDEFQKIPFDEERKSKRKPNDEKEK